MLHLENGDKQLGRQGIATLDKHIYDGSAMLRDDPGDIKEVSSRTGVFGIISSRHPTIKKCNIAASPPPPPSC
jgi:hypothetical protein